MPTITRPMKKLERIDYWRISMEAAVMGFRRAAAIAAARTSAIRTDLAPLNLLDDLPDFESFMAARRDSIKEVVQEVVQEINDAASIVVSWTKDKLMAAARMLDGAPDFNSFVAARAMEKTSDTEVTAAANELASADTLVLDKVVWLDRRKIERAYSYVVDWFQPMAIAS